MTKLFQYLIKNKKETVFFTIDEHPRLSALEKLASLKACLKKTAR